MKRSAKEKSDFVSNLNDIIKTTSNRALIIQYIERETGVSETYKFDNAFAARVSRMQLVFDR